MTAFGRCVARAVVVGALMALVASTSMAADAAFSTTGAGSGAGAAVTVPTGSTPVATVSNRAVSVSWNAVAMSDGVDVAGYVVTRVNAATGLQATIGSGCAGVLGTTSCVELSVPAGSWVYTETPVQDNWSGVTSAASAPVTVAAG